MVTADGDMWTALAVKVMGDQVAVRDLRIYRLPPYYNCMGGCCERSERGVWVIGALRDTDREGHVPGHVINPQMRITNKWI